MLLQYSLITLLYAGKGVYHSGNSNTSKISPCTVSLTSFGCGPVAAGAFTFKTIESRGTRSL